jgi:hypothetical protein
MTKYTTKKGQQGEDVLNINGIQSICPFTPALVVGGNLGQTQIIRLPCSTVCPFATLEREDAYCINCTGSAEWYELENQDMIEDQSKIIKLV